jgi:hypothetical protein
LYINCRFLLLKSTLNVNIFLMGSQMKQTISKFNYYKTTFSHAKSENENVLNLKIESPLEQAFAGYWISKWGYNCVDKHGDIINTSSKNVASGVIKSRDCDERIIKIKSQYKIIADGVKRRIDFMFICNAIPDVGFKVNEYYREHLEVLYMPNLIQKEFKYGVEVEGHEWHEKTKEQVARDNKRERSISRKGYDIHCFSSSELVYNFEKCIEEIEDYIEIKGNKLKEKMI